MTRRIAVYGSLRQGEYNHRQDMGEMVAQGVITNAALYTLGAFPCIVATDNTDDSVVVEVYDLPEKVFDGIHRMEIGAGYEIKPATVQVTKGLCDICTCGDDECNHDILAAEAYFYPEVKDWFGARITSGDWSQR